MTEYKKKNRIYKNMKGKKRWMDDLLNVPHENVISPMEKVRLMYII